MSQSQTHQSILQGAKSGDSLAWQRLTDLYRPLLAGWAHRYATLNRDAEDLTQEILMQVVRYLPRFEHNGRPGAFRAWLRTIAAHATSDFVAARSRQPQGTGDSALSANLSELADPHAENAVTEAWDREHDQFVLNRLLEVVAMEFEPQSMAVFRRLAFECAAAETVASELNLSLGSIYTAKSRVLKRLRELSEDLLDWGKAGCKPIK